MHMNFDAEEDKNFNNIDKHLSPALPFIPMVSEINLDNLAKTFNASLEQVIYFQQ